MCPIYEFVNEKDPLDIIEEIYDINDIPESFKKDNKTYIRKKISRTSFRLKGDGWFKTGGY